MALQTQGIKPNSNETWLLRSISSGQSILKMTQFDLCSSHFDEGILLYQSGVKYAIRAIRDTKADFIIVSI